MLNAMIYARHNGKRFVLNTEDWNHKFSYGFVDYFESFAEKTELKPGECSNNTVFEQQNAEWMKKINQLSGISEPINFEDLKLVGSIEQVKRAFALAVWQIKPQIRQKIEKEIAKLDLGQEYNVLQIRRGDKSIEAKPVEVAQYVSRLAKLQTNSDKAVFVMTDDCRTVDEVKKMLSSTSVKSLCVSEEAGHDQATFNSLPPQKKLDATIKLLTEIEIARNSNYFIGTFSSNIPRLIYLLHKNRKNMIGIESGQKNWHYR